MSNDGINRPIKFGAADRREYIVQDSEVSYISINDSNANPVYIGRAKAGLPITAPKWQIRHIQYDSNQGITRITWPEGEDGAASANYEFLWESETALTITGISKANPAVITVSSLGNLSNGQTIILQGVGGMTEVNFTGTNTYTVANISAGPKTFELSGIDSTAFTAYTSGGTVTHGGFAGYVYS